MSSCIFYDKKEIEEGIVYKTDDFFVKVSFGVNLVVITANPSAPLQSSSAPAP